MFTIGRTTKTTIKAAVIVEDVARTVWLALQIGKPEEIPEMNKLHYQYTHVYGQ